MEPFHVLEITDIASNGVFAEKFRISLDDMKLKGVVGYQLDRQVGDIATITLRLNVALKIGIPIGMDVTSLEDKARLFVDGIA